MTHASVPLADLKKMRDLLTDIIMDLEDPSTTSSKQMTDGDSPEKTQDSKESQSPPQSSGNTPDSTHPSSVKDLVDQKCKAGAVEPDERYEELFVLCGENLESVSRALDLVREVEKKVTLTSPVALAISKVKKDPASYRESSERKEITPEDLERIAGGAVL